MTTTATIQTTHDRITVRIKFANGDKLNLTQGRSGQTVSGSDRINLHGVLDAFEAFMTAKGATYGDKMARVQEIAAGAVDGAAFRTSLATAIPAA